ncbi:type II methionyl aminopeptidase [Candidatus Woesearchaeota archaeon CG10_big_fil_rev_8_21_14_0_10_32_9]|nr:MAG: type II methionyl aminopeptidase [Candidatus Woesearchaeota archaeon CG10_big_fil_rev_8_21_14_0_10_32_9]
MQKEELDSFVLAGRIACDALDFGEKLIKPGQSMILILDQIEEFIKSQGAELAFPPQISLNNVAAHFCPDQEDVLLKEGDVVKLDVGTSINGYIADTARTIDLGNNTELVNASKDALAQALKLIRPGVQIGELGKTIQETIMSHGFSPIRNLSGHGVGRYRIHGAPTIPNVETGDITELKENQTIAIEPFATTGAGIVYESGVSTIFTLRYEKPVRSPMARQVLQEIKKYNGLPFASRWLTKKFGVAKTSIALRELSQLGMLDAHPPLLDKAQGLVSQAEHSVIVKDKAIIYTKNK